MGDEAGAHLPARWRGLARVTAAVSVGALVVIVLCQQFAARQYGPRGVEVGSTGYTLAQIASSLAFASGVFLGVFLAGQVRAALELRREHGRRVGLLAALATELRLATPGVRVAEGAYRDPVRLALPARLLDGVALDGDGDRPLVAALLGLQATAARYNDLVLTNAIILLDGDDARLRALTARYRADLDRAIADTLALLPPAAAA